MSRDVSVSEGAEEPPMISNAQCKNVAKTRLSLRERNNIDMLLSAKLRKITGASSQQTFSWFVHLRLSLWGSLGGTITMTRTIILMVTVIAAAILQSRLK